MHRPQTLAAAALAVAALVSIASHAQGKPAAPAKKTTTPQTATTPAAAAARAEIEKTMGFVPEMLAVLPDAALPSSWNMMKSLQMNDKTKLSGKTKELVGLGVAAQIPCWYCVYAHKAFAKAGGASEQEIAEAIAVAGGARMRSTDITGLHLDEDAMVADVKRMTESAKNQKSASTTPPVVLTDKASALKEAERLYGFTPRFLQQLPDESVPGVVMTLRDVIGAKTALSQRDKALVMLGVDAQSSCTACVAADNVMAKAAGATDVEIGEAVGMAGLTRHFSTMLNGAQIDEARFKNEIDRLSAPKPGAAASSKKD